MLFLLACATSSPPDPDTLLREGRLTEALAAFEAESGRHIPASHPTAQTLAQRAPAEPWITLPILADFTEAASILDSVPATRSELIDVSFEQWGPMAGCTASMLSPPWRVVVGRSAVAADPDPHENGRPFENVPYARGRVIGMASALSAAAQAQGRERLAELFAGIDKDPPAHRVTVVLVEDTGSFAVHLSRQEGVWWTSGATKAEPAAAWIGRCGAGS